MQRNSRGSIETQRNSRETTAGTSKPRPRPTARAVAVGNLSGPPQKRPEEATRGRNSRETTWGASKCNGIRAKPQREHRNATEFARNHSGSIETKAPSHRRARAVAVSNQFLYSERKNPIVQALFGEKKSNDNEHPRLCHVKALAESSKSTLRSVNPASEHQEASESHFACFICTTKQRLLRPGAPGGSGIPSRIRNLYYKATSFGGSELQ